MKKLYNFMKKIGAALMITSIAAVTIASPLSVSADEAEVSYLLRAENFRLETEESGWTIENETGMPEIPTYYNTQNEKDSKIYADVFFPEDGNYLVWAYVKGFPLDFASKRTFKMDIGDFCDDSPIYANWHPDTWYWQAGDIAKIKKGWRKVMIEPLGADVSVGAVYITNNLKKDVKKLSDYSTLASEADTEPPIFESGTLSIAEGEGKTLNLKWPKAADSGSGLAGYIVDVNGYETFYDKNITEAAISNLWSLDKANIKVHAVDSLGNRATVSAANQVISSFSDVKLEITDASGNTLTGPVGLSAGDKVRAEVSLKNSADKGEDISLGISVYSTETGKMIANQRKTISVNAQSAISGEFVEITLPSGFDKTRCKIKASLWSVDDMPHPVWESTVIENN